MTEVNQPNENANTTNTTFYIEHQRISVNDIANHVGDGNPRFGVVRDRLFHAMLAIILLSILIYTHFLVAHYPAGCLDEIKQNWPIKGIVRIEVVHDNLPRLKEYQLRIIEDGHSSNNCPLISYNSCYFNPAEILRTGVLPIDIKNPFKTIDPKNSFISSLPDRVRRSKKFLFPFWIDCFYWLLEKFRKFQQILDEALDIYVRLLLLNYFQNLFEFSLHYGLLRLNSEMRQELGVNIMDVQLDVGKDKCLKDWREKPLMRFLIGIDELIMSSVKQLSENQTERGYLRDLINGELYHFVNVGEHSASRYLTALFVMLVFTFAISMLLRFSHDQIFVFIVDLFQMFEQNQPLIFPIAPLLTVILALVGVYSSLALLTSAAFTLHSMVYFFHHYELPHIIYQERLINAVRRINDENGDGNVDLVRIRQMNGNGTRIALNNTLRVTNRLSNSVATNRGALEIMENVSSSEPNNINQNVPTSSNLENVDTSSTSVTENQSSNLPPAVETIANSIVDEAMQEAETFVSSLETQHRLNNI
uniref:Uncharacterized protein n=1 Tax=Meloidogyne hapla TaxID=6305 RepID=A0A1I8BFS4_MELHA